jgi:hypothetical protein
MKLFALYNYVIRLTLREMQNMGKMQTIASLIPAGITFP